MPLLPDADVATAASQFDDSHVNKIIELVGDQKKLEAMPVNEFVDLWVVKK